MTEIGVREGRREGGEERETGREKESEWQWEREKIFDLLCHSPDG